MTIQHVIETLDTFRDEYNTSIDPEVKKLCGFITSTVNTLNAYLATFTKAKSHIELSQEYYEGALETINKLIIENAVDPGGDESAS